MFKQQHSEERNKIVDTLFKVIRDRKKSSLSEELVVKWIELYKADHDGLQANEEEAEVFIL